MTKPAEVRAMVLFNFPPQLMDVPDRIILILPASVNTRVTITYDASPHSEMMKMRGNFMRGKQQKENLFRGTGVPVYLNIFPKYRQRVVDTESPETSTP